MNSVRIVADSGCDISPELAAEYQITIIPLYVRFGEEAILDSELTMTDFWQRADRSSEIPATAVPAPSVYQQAFQRLVSAGHDVVCLTLPGRHSGAFNTAWLAAQEFGQRVRVIDSGQITAAMGLQVLAAAREALAGRSSEMIQQKVENLRSRTSVIFVLDTLEWVRRGGRMARLMPLIERMARTFHIKPIAEIVEGDIRLLGVARSYRSALARVEDEVRSRLPVETVMTAYTRGKESANELVDGLGRLLNVPPGQIAMQQAGPIFAVHAGPNAVGAVVVRS